MPRTVPSRRLRVPGAALLALASLAGCAPAGPPTAPPIGTVVCKDYGTATLVPLAWSADGRAIAVRYLEPNSPVVHAATLSWPGFTTREFYAEETSLEALTIDSSGSTLYYWGEHDGTEAVWALRPNRQPTLVGGASIGTRAGIGWTPLGIVRGVYGDDPSYGGVDRIDWTGAQETLLPMAKRDDVWVDPSGDWLVTREQLDTTGPAELVVYHAGQSIVLRPPTSPDLIGMTSDHTAVVYRTAADANDDVTPLVLHLLPLDGAPERTLTVSVPLRRGITNLILSSTGLLAFTDVHYESHEICIVPLSLPKLG